MSRIILGDCLEIMPTLPDKSVDMILCDLPYGTTACSWDTIIPFEPLWKEYKRLIKDGGAIVLTASQPFTSALVMSNPEWFKCEWIWEKNAGSNFASLKYVPMKEHENILVFGKRRVNYYPIMQKRTLSGEKRYKTSVPASNGRREAYNGLLDKGEHWHNPQERYPRSIQKFNRERGLHPTQKPVALFEYLIKTYTLEGELVLDNCIGSGTTALAARNTGRNYIGIEINPDYVKIAQDRLKQEVLL